MYSSLERFIRGLERRRNDLPTRTLNNLGGLQRGDNPNGSIDWHCFNKVKEMMDNFDRTLIIFFLAVTLILLVLEKAL